MADEVLRERRGNVEILTINRPEARNAINGAVSKAMSALMDELAEDPDCWVVVITGSGDKAFSAGMDLKAFSSGEGGDIMGASGGFGGLTQRDFPKPIIAAVNGSALAGGFEIMLSCDLVVAADHATFGIPEAKRGLIAGAGGLIRMPKRLPMAVALELAMTGDPIDAERAYALGLVNKVVPGDALLAEAVALAERIAANAPLAVRYSKSVMKRAAEVPESEGWTINAEAVGVVFSSADAMEGPGRLRREARRRTGRASSSRRARPGARHRPPHPPRPGRDGVGRRADRDDGPRRPRPGFGGEAPKMLARAFARLAWPAFVVLVVTGIWNVTAVHYSAPGLGLEGRADGQDRRRGPGRRRRLPAPAGHRQGPARPLGVGRRPGQRGRAGDGHPPGRLTPNTPATPGRRADIRDGNGSNLGSRSPPRGPG